MARRSYRPRAQGRGIALPETFKCATCNLWKPSSNFSHNQRARWHQMKKHEDDGITAESIGLECKDHKLGEPEMKCAGPCGKSKVKSQFSRTQRNKRNAWCMLCTDWKTRHPGEQIPDPAPNEEVTPDQFTGRITAYDGGIIYGLDHNYPDSDISIDSSDVSDEDTDNELDDQDREGEDYRAREKGNRRGPASIFSAYQSTVFSHEHDERDILSTIGANSAIGSSFSQTSTATAKAPARGKAKAIQRNASYTTGSIVSRASRADTQGSLATNNAGRLPPHLRHLGSSRTNSYYSSASREINSSRPSNASSSFQEGVGSSSARSIATSETMTNYDPHLYNANVFTPQGDVFTRTLGSGSRNQKSAAANSTTNRSTNSKFYKGDSRSMFYAPRSFAKMPNDRTEPSSLTEGPEYSGDSSDDF